MNILPMSFWGGWAAGIFLLGLCWLAWLALGAWRSKDVHAPNEVWDGDLREGNDTPPKWWFYTLFIMLIYSAGYVVLYPGFGDSQGILGWNQHKQFAEGMAYYRARTSETRQHWADAPLATLREDDSAMHSARRLFAVHCAACHGDNGNGQAGLFPALMDDEWQWGSSEAQIMHTLRHGRAAAMPGWEAVLGAQGVEAVADYVLALAAGTASADHPGHAAYAANCVACHGARGEGNVALGAPRFIDGHRWVYVEDGSNGVRAGIVRSIREGRNGIMPAQSEQQGGRLSEAQMRVLAAWLSGGSDIAPPGRRN